MKAALKYSFVDAYSFDELVEYGLKHTTNIVNGMTWSFALDADSCILRVTHENDNVYIVGSTRFERGTMLVINSTGDVFTLSTESFQALYKRIP